MNEKISVILPAYNEEAAIDNVLSEVTAVLKEHKYDFEIIVVDDASTDRTAEKAQKAGVKLIRHRFNKGVGAARKTGVINASGDIIVMLDVDGTYPAKSIPELIKHFPEYDQVIGCRNTEHGTLRLLRQPTKWLLFQLASFLAKQKIPDLNSGFRALKRNILLKYLYLVPNGFSCVSTMTLVFLCNGYNVKYVPIEYYKRIGSSKFRIFTDTRDFLFTIIRIVMYFNPLRIFIPIASFLLAAGLIKTVYDVFFSSIQRVTGTDILLILSALIILTFGLLADLIVTQGKRGS